MIDSPRVAPDIAGNENRGYDPRGTLGRTELSWACQFTGGTVP